MPVPCIFVSEIWPFFQNDICLPLFRWIKLTWTFSIRLHVNSYRGPVICLASLTSPTFIRFSTGHTHTSLSCSTNFCWSKNKNHHDLDTQAYMCSSFSWKFTGHGHRGKLQAVSKFWVFPQGMWSIKVTVTLPSAWERQQGATLNLLGLEAHGCYTQLSRLTYCAWNIGSVTLLI